jgi:hypothetical protein
MKRSELEVGQLVLVEKRWGGGPAIVLDTEPWHDSGSWRSSPRKGVAYGGGKQGVAIALMGRGVETYRYARVIEEGLEAITWVPEVVQLRQLRPLDADHPFDYMTAVLERVAREEKALARLRREREMQQAAEDARLVEQVRQWSTALLGHGVEATLDLSTKYGEDRVTLSAEDFTKVVAALG